MKLSYLLLFLFSGYLQAANWGTIQDDGCVLEYGGVKKYSARLWNISGSWEKACNVQPVVIKGVSYKRPHQCINNFGMWGEWYVPDTACKSQDLQNLKARWGKVKREQCVTVPGLSNGEYRKYSSRLWDIPQGESWEAACSQWPIEIAGITFDGNVKSPGSNGFKLCKNEAAFGMWGEFYIKDKTCQSYNTYPASGSKQVNSGTLYGYADLHTHPFANEAFGGAIFGSANGDLDKAFSNYNPNDDVHRNFAWLSRNISATDVLDYVAIAAVPESSKYGWIQGSGYPFFDKGTSVHDQDAWPRIWDNGHQKVHNTWVKRAVKGGMRLMVSLAANADAMFGHYEETRIPEIAHISAGTPKLSLDDWDAFTRQTKAAHTFNKENDWVELALTPQDAKNAISQGKLAMIWGNEVDHAYKCKLDIAKSPQTQSSKVCDRRDIDVITQVHDMLGVRYLFPVHLKNNSLGYAGSNSPAAWNGNDINKGMVTCEENDSFAGFSEGNSDCGRGGFSDLGLYAIRKSWALGHVIDGDHTSRIGHKQLISMAKSFNVPVVRGHTGFFSVSVDERRHEGNVSTQQVKDVLDTGGMVGAIVFQGRMKNVANMPNATISHTCSGTSQTFANSIDYLRSVGAGTYRGADNQIYGNMSFGTDFNGYAVMPSGRDQNHFFLSELEKRECYFGKSDPQIAKKVNYPFNLPPQLKTMYHNTGNTLNKAELTKSEANSRVDYNKRGLATVAQLPDFMEDLFVQGMSMTQLEGMYRSALGFADMWQRLSHSAEQSVYWFNEALLNEYTSHEYPDRVIPKSYLTTINGTKVCRAPINHSNGKFSHYVAGVVKKGICYSGNERNRDYDTLAPRFHAGTFKWGHINKNLSNNLTHFYINADNHNKKRLCRLTGSKSNQKAAGYVDNNYCIATQVANNKVNIKRVSIFNKKVELLVVKAPMMALEVARVN